MKGYRATANQIGYIKGLAKKKGIEIDSKELDDLKTFEADRMIKKLMDAGVSKNMAESDRMRKKILSMAITVGWTINTHADVERVNNWCIKYGHGHKPLNDYKVFELPKLVSQFQYVVLRHKLSKDV